MLPVCSARVIVTYARTNQANPTASTKQAENEKWSKKEKHARVGFDPQTFPFVHSPITGQSHSVTVSSSERG